MLAHNSVQPHNNTEERERERERETKKCIVAAKYLHQPYYQCVCRTRAGPGFLPFNCDNLSQPLPASITPRSKGALPATASPQKKEECGGGGSRATGILKTVFIEGKHKRTNKGVCSQEALITATTIRVMRPDGRTV